MARMRIRSAEVALEEGRLEEAIRIVLMDDLTSEKRAQSIRREAGGRLFDRAQERFQCGKYDSALRDLDLAERTGLDATKIGNLRAIILGARDDTAKRHADCQLRMADVQKRMKRGNFAAASEAIKNADFDRAQADKLRIDLEHRRSQFEKLLSDAQGFMSQRNFSMAAECVRQAIQACSDDVRLAGIVKNLVECVSSDCREAIVQGRLASAVQTFQSVAGLGENLLCRQEVADSLKRVQRASKAIMSGDYDQARRNVLILQQVLPEAKWLDTLAAQLQDVDERVTRLHASPLGLSLVSLYDASTEDKPLLGNVKVGEHAKTFSGPFRDSASLPEKLLVLIDGSGSYLLITKLRAVIGNHAAPEVADIPIMADLSQKHAEIVRLDEDYFLYAKRDVNVGGENLNQRLLHDGDRITLARRAKLIFRLPSRKSTTAVLQLGDITKLPHGVRQVILFDQCATIGCGPNAHMRVNTAGEDLLLYLRKDRLWIRPCAGARGDDGQPLRLGHQLDMHGVGIVVVPWESMNS